jgi:glutamate formiminotransferase
VFECVVNISEGRDGSVLDELSQVVTSSLRDRHTDRFHNRSVFTLINRRGALVDDVHLLVRAAFERLDLRNHEGVHPRFGVVDVVPFVALESSEGSEAVAMRDETAQWISNTFHVPTFLYGPVMGTTRTLPQVRRDAFGATPPDFGPTEPSPTLGAVAVGARPVLVAWNIWLSHVSLRETREIAAAVRQPAVRAMGFELGDQTQISCNLIDPEEVGPSEVYDEVQRLLPATGTIERAELVGLIPQSVLDAENSGRWDELGLSPQRTIERQLPRD